MTQAHEGGCLCGAVRWRADDAPITMNFCHCGMCRRASGAPVVAWATFARARVAFPAGQPAWRRSSATAERAFCAACGSALAWRADRSPDRIDLTVGSCDRPDALTPQEHIWTENALP